jgi:hypothetical protein
MSVYNRLGYNFDSTQFNGADILTPGVINLLNNTNINLSPWQINDLSNNTVGGYYQNPHQYTLATLSLYLDALSTLANTQFITYTNATNAANTLSATLSALSPSLINFTSHTNNLSGVTQSANSMAYPDLSSGLSVGRQMLNITNTTDGIQNNTPILGTFTSLYVGNTLSSLSITIKNDYITLNNSISIISGNSTSNITNAAMNVIVSDVQTLKTLVETRRNGDITFYTNSLAVLHDYQTLLPFSNMGATQNSLIKLIGTSKLHNAIGY